MSTAGATHTFLDDRNAIGPTEAILAFDMYHAFDIPQEYLNFHILDRMGTLLKLLRFISLVLELGATFTRGHLKTTPPPPSPYSKAPRTRRNTTSPGTIWHPNPCLPHPPRCLRHHQRRTAGGESPTTTGRRDAPGTISTNHTKRPRTEPPTHPITTMGLPQQHRTTPDRNGFRDLPREWAVHNGTLRWDEITPGLQAIRLHWITAPTTTWALPTGRQHLLLTVQGDATITPTEGDPVTAAPAHAVHIPPQASSTPMAVYPGPTPWQAIVITHPAPNDHTHTWQQRSEDIRGDLFQEHLGVTRTHHTLHPKRGVGQAPHGIHTPGLWAYATPINPQAAEDIKTALSMQQAQIQTPHRNTQRGYTIWWAYQDHDTLSPQPGAPPLDTNTTALL